MIEYKVVSAHEAVMAGFPDTAAFRDLIETGSGGFYCLYKFVGGCPEKLVATDGGEPEDQIFIRDWSWVAPLLTEMAEEIYSLQSALDCSLEGSLDAVRSAAAALAEGDTDKASPELLEALRPLCPPKPTAEPYSSIVDDYEGRNLKYIIADQATRMNFITCHVPLIHGSFACDRLQRPGGGYYSTREATSEESSSLTECEVCK